MSVHVAQDMRNAPVAAAEEPEMSSNYVIGPVTLADGTVAYMSTEPDQTITAPQGNFLIADFGGGATISVGDGDSSVFATLNDDTVTTGQGNYFILAGVSATVTVGSNNGGSNQSVVGAGKGSTITVGNGNNILFLNGASETVTTGTGTDVVFATALGNNTVTFGNGSNWVYLNAYNNTVASGGGTDTDWLGLGNDTVAPSHNGGTDFVYRFNSSDHIDLSKILGGISLTGAALSPYVTVTTAAEAANPALIDTLVSIKGATGATASVELYAYNGGNLQSMISQNVFTAPSSVTL